MKIAVAVIVSCFLSSGLLAQDNIFNKMKSKKSRADQYFEDFNYPEALALYLEIYKNNPTKQGIALQIAESYRRLNNPEKTVQWFEKVVYDENITDDKHYLYLAQALLKLQEYDQAEIWIKKYKNSNGYDDHSFNRELAYVEWLVKHPDKANISGVSINTDNDEFCPVLLDNSLIYLSNKPNKNLIKRIDSWTDRSFYKVYKAKKLNNIYLGRAKSWKVAESHKYNFGPVAFYNKNQSAVYTSNNEQAGKNQLKSLQLYFADVKKDKLSNTTAFPYNEFSSSMGHPSLNEQGNVLIFTSDIPGGLGGTDLYYSLKENGRWTIPRNFGEDINSAGDEMFPYLYQDSILFYSSNGKTGLGGHDVYYSPLDSDFNCTASFNPGFPLNTAYDDFSLVLNSNNVEGYLSSNRPGGRGGDDIYYFSLQYIPVVVDLGNYSGQLAIYENDKLRNSISSATGKEVINLMPGSSYKINVDIDNNQQKSIIIPQAGLQHINKEYTVIFGSL